MIIDDYVGKGGSVRTDQIPKLTDLERSSKPTTELIIDDPEIISRFKN